MCCAVLWCVSQVLARGDIPTPFLCSAILLYAAGCSVFAAHVSPLYAQPGTAAALFALMTVPALLCAVWPSKVTETQRRAAAAQPIDKGRLSEEQIDPLPPVAQPAAQPAARPAAMLASQTMSQPAAQPAAQTVSQPVLSTGLDSSIDDDQYISSRVQPSMVSARLLMHCMLY